MGFILTPLFCWLVILVVMLIVEFATQGLTTIWFAFGSIVGLILAALKLPIWLQVIGFAVVSLLLLIFTRQIALKYYNNSRLKTNVCAMVGKQAVVIADIDNNEGLGQVKVEGMEWSARSLNGAMIKIGEVVTVKSVEGVKLIVDRQK